MGNEGRSPSSTVPRRTVIALMSAGLASAALGRSDKVLSGEGATGAILATPAQIEAEKTLLRLLKQPKLKQLQATIKAKWAATPRGQMSDGAATLDEAIAQWTNSLIFGELAENQASPALLWGTDDTPRTWLGHRIGGVGTSGDNPDAVYRSGIIDGDNQYEILGKFDVGRKPTQFVLELDATRLTKIPKIDYSKNSDLVTTVSMLTDRDIVTDPDGSFRITVGGQGEGPNHMATKPGTLTVGVRDIIPDWERQRPARLSVRQVAGKPFAPATYAETAQHVHEDLEGYVEFWAAFPDVWFGGLHGNKIAEPKPRNGGWGFVNGLSFDLAAPDDAILVTLDPAGAAYTGFQINDPWMIAPDAKKYQVCLSSAQAVGDADGTRTYVISMTDPGVANWLDTAGLHQGLAIMRWQALSKTTTKDSLVREFRVLKHSDLVKLPDLARVTPAQRKAAIAARARGYANRTT